MKKLFLIVFALLIFSVCFAPPIPLNVVRRFELTNWDWTTKGFWVAESLSRFNNGIFFPDNSKAMFGNTPDNPDMSIYSDGTNPKIDWTDGTHPVGLILKVADWGNNKYLPYLRFMYDNNGNPAYGIGMFSHTLQVQDVEGSEPPMIALYHHNYPTTDKFAYFCLDNLGKLVIESHGSDMLFKVDEDGFNTTFNEDAWDSDFKVGGTGKWLISTDAENDRVGICTETSEAELDVHGTICLEGSTTGFFKDGSNNLCLYDANADTITLDNIPLLDADNTWTGTNQFDSTITVGVDDTGYDVKFFGATADKYLLWDESEDELLLKTTGAGNQYSPYLQLYTSGGGGAITSNFYNFSTMLMGSSGLFITCNKDIKLTANSGAGYIKMDGILQFDNNVKVGFGGAGSFRPLVKVYVTSNKMHFNPYNPGFQTISEFVFNEDSYNTDFRIESNTDANCFFMDAGNNNITINGSAVSAHYDLMLAGDGVLGLQETITPTADTDYGKVYCKNDNKLYFQDGAGSEHETALLDNANIWTANQTFEAEVMGGRFYFGGGTNGIKTVSAYLQGFDGQLYQSDLGVCAMHDGSIIGCSVTFNAGTVTSGGDLIFEVRQNGTAIFSVTVSTTTTGHKSGYATQARGTDIFSAGDILTCYYNENANDVSVDDIQMWVEGVYDD